MKKKPKSSKNQKNNQSNLNNYAKYSTIAFQMIAIILVATWGGIKLDSLTGFEKPVFTITLENFLYKKDNVIPMADSDFQNKR